MSSTIQEGLPSLESLLGPISAPADGLPTPVTGVVSTGATSPVSGAFSEVAFATLVGVSTRRVREMRKDGVIQRDASGRYAQTEVAKYCAFLRKGGSSGSDSDELKAEKLRQARAATRKLERQAALLEGETVYVADVAQKWGDTLRAVRAGILAVPARCKAALPDLPPEVTVVIDREVRLALEVAADEQ